MKLTEVGTLPDNSTSTELVGGSDVAAALLAAFGCRSVPRTDPALLGGDLLDVFGLAVHGDVVVGTDGAVHQRSCPKSAGCTRVTTADLLRMGGHACNPHSPCTQSLLARGADPFFNQAWEFATDVARAVTGCPQPSSDAPEAFADVRRLRFGQRVGHAVRRFGEQVSLEPGTREPVEACARWTDRLSTAAQQILHRSGLRSLENYMAALRAAAERSDLAEYRSRLSDAQRALPGDADDHVVCMFLTSLPMFDVAVAAAPHGASMPCTARWPEEVYAAAVLPRTLALPLYVESERMNLGQWPTMEGAGVVDLAAPGLGQAVKTAVELWVQDPDVGTQDAWRAAASVSM